MVDTFISPANRTETLGGYNDVSNAPLVEIPGGYMRRACVSSDYLGGL